MSTVADRNSISDLRIDPLNLNFTPQGKTTPLHTATKRKLHDEMERKINEGKVDIDALDEYGDTALHIAVGKGDLEAVTILVQSGAKRDITNSAGQTPIELAESKHHRKIVTFLQKIDQSVPEITGNIAKKTLFKSVVSLFKTSEDQNKATQETKTPQKNAKANNPKSKDAIPPKPTGEESKERLETLFEAPEVKSNEVPTSENGDTALMRRIRKKNAMITEEELQRLDLNAQNDQGDTALHLAVKAGKIRLASLLIDCGAKINIRNRNNRTPLEEAPETQKEVMEEAFKTAFHRAVNHSVSRCEGLFKHGFDPNFPNKNGDTPLHIAVRNLRPETVKSLFDTCKVEPNVLNLDKKTPLDIALHDINAITEEEIKLKKEITSILLLNGADSKQDRPYDQNSLRKYSKVFLSQNELEEKLSKQSKVLDFSTQLFKRFSFSAIYQIGSNTVLPFSNITNFLTQSDFATAFETLKQASFPLNPFSIIDNSEHLFEVLTAYKNQTVVYAVAAWLATSCAINSLIPSFHMTMSHSTRRILSDALAGTVVFSAAYFGGVDMQQLGFFALGTYFTEFAVKSAWSVGKLASSLIFQKCFGIREESRDKPKVIADSVGSLGRRQTLPF